MEKEKLQKIYDEAVSDENNLVYMGNGIYSTPVEVSTFEEFDEVMRSNGFVKLEDSKWVYIM